MTLSITDTLRDLVAIPSVNPMGRATIGPEMLEDRLTDYLVHLFRRLGWRYERQPIAPRRDNILARIDGPVTPEQGGPLVMFEVHQDTVPVDGMTIEPFAARVDNGRLWGRGACDVKGGMTAMLAACARLADDGRREKHGPRPTVLLACTVNEEYGFTGATGLCRLWSDLKSPLVPRRPDAAVTAEPTQLRVVVAHKGVVRWRCHTRGRAAHSSRPELGNNAIYRMAAVVAALERYERDVLRPVDPHPLCGGPTLNVGTIRGGISVNTVPDECTIEIDRRLAPGEQPEAAYRHVVDFVSEQLGAAGGDRVADGVVHDSPFMLSPGLSEQSGAALAERLSSVARQIARRGERLGVPFGTDAAAIAASGVPSVVFGPGSIDQAHTADEWIELAEIEAASEILYRLICDWA